MDTKKITTSQHYVPQFYLKNFVNENNKLEILNCERHKIVISRSPKSVCCGNFFYSVNNERDEMSQIMEYELQKIESDISREYAKIANKFINFEQITDNDKMIVSSFMSLQLLRGPYMRKQIANMSEKVTKEIFAMQFDSPNIQKFFDKYETSTGKKVSNKDKDDVAKLVKEKQYHIKFGNGSHLNIMSEMKGFRNLLYAKQWLVYISKSSKKFITSDNPVIELFPEWTGKFFYGPDFLQRTHKFAMTPEILIVATDDPKVSPPKIGKIQRKTLFDNKIDNEKILELNLDYPRFAVEYAYSNNKIFLQDILDKHNDFIKKRDIWLKNVIRDSL